MSSDESDSSTSLQQRLRSAAPAPTLASDRPRFCLVEVDVVYAPGTREVVGAVLECDIVDDDDMCGRSGGGKRDAASLRVPVAEIRLGLELRATKLGGKRTA